MGSSSRSGCICCPASSAPARPSLNLFVIHPYGRILISHLLGFLEVISWHVSTRTGENIWACFPQLVWYHRSPLSSFFVRRLYYTNDVRSTKASGRGEIVTVRLYLSPCPISFFSSHRTSRSASLTSFSGITENGF